jgi:uncharacterized protein (TIGR03435 family)
MGGTIGFLPTGGMSARNISLHGLIELAYDMPGYCVSGGPTWIEVSGYDVDAKPMARVGLAEARLMLQALLADRFGLRVHDDTKLVNGFRLLAPNGPNRLVQSNTAAGHFRVMSMSEMRGQGVTMPMLVRGLKAILGVPVEDDTQLGGSYDISLKYASENAGPDDGPSLLSALRRELGLELKKDKVSLKIIVIDHAEKARPN